MSSYIKKNLKPNGTITICEIRKRLLADLGVKVSKDKMKNIIKYFNFPPIKEIMHSDGETIRYYPVECYEQIKQFIIEHPDSKNFFSKLWREQHEDEHKQSLEHQKKTMQERYGVDNPGQISGHKEKMEATFLKTHGEDIATHRSKSWYATREQREQKYLGRYGVISPLITKECQEKARSEEALARRKENYLKTCQEKYGVKNTAQVPEVKEKIVNGRNRTREERVKYVKEVLNGVTEQEIIEQYKIYDIGIREILKRYGKQIYNYKNVSYVLKDDLIVIDDALKKLSLAEPCYSVMENELKKFIESIYDDEVVCHERSVIPPKELDIYIPKLKIGVEFNGNYWHSMLYRQKDYHQQKSLSCVSQGVQLIHIYEYEWKNPQKQSLIKQYLKNIITGIDKKIYARKCTVKEIDNATARQFNEVNHFQGHRNARVNLGLFYNDELVQIMTFSHHKKYEWEITRECSLSDTRVVGGCSKLFNYFIKTYNPSQIMSYCDFNKFLGKSYENMGMTFDGYTTPDMKWLLRDATVVNRQPKRNKELKENSVSQIFGAGNKRYLWNKV